MTVDAGSLVQVLGPRVGHGGGSKAMRPRRRTSAAWGKPLSWPLLSHSRVSFSQSLFFSLKEYV